MRAAPHDGHVAVPAGDSVEHHGQWIGLAAVDSSGMADILARSIYPPPPRWSHDGGTDVGHSHSMVAGGLLLMS